MSPLRASTAALRTVSTARSYSHIARSVNAAAIKSDFQAKTADDLVAVARSELLRSAEINAGLAAPSKVSTEEQQMRVFANWTKPEGNRLFSSQNEKAL